MHGLVGTVVLWHFPRGHPGWLQPLPGAHRRLRSLQTWGPGVVVGKVSSLLTLSLAVWSLVAHTGQALPSVWPRCLAASPDVTCSGVSASARQRELFQDSVPPGLFGTLELEL